VSDEADHGHGQAAPLEAPTGSHRVRGPTAFVLGVMLLIAITVIVRTCA